MPHWGSSGCPSVPGGVLVGQSWGAWSGGLGCLVGRSGVPGWGGLGWCLVKWVHGAACAGESSPGDWFASDDDLVARAVAVCGGCPVRLKCLEAGAGESGGVWGGVSRDWGQEQEKDWERSEARRAASRRCKRKRLAEESPEQREARLAAGRESQGKQLARESPVQREARLAARREADQVRWAQARVAG